MNNLPTELIYVIHVWWNHELDCEIILTGKQQWLDLEMYYNIGWSVNYFSKFSTILLSRMYV